MNHLDRLMQATLTQLQLASHTSAMKPLAGDLEQRVTTGKAGSHEPPRVDDPSWKYLARYREARNDTQRRVVIAEALDELRSIRYSRKPTVDRETLEGRLMIGRDPRPAHVVAYVYGFSVRHVHRLRADAKRFDT